MLSYTYVVGDAYLLGFFLETGDEQELELELVAFNLFCVKKAENGDGGDFKPREEDAEAEEAWAPTVLVSSDKGIANINYDLQKLIICN